MAHTFTSLHYHCVFGTLGRRNLIPQDLLSRLHAYLGGILRNVGCLPLTIGGITNHAHMLITIPPAGTLSSIVGKVKSNSAGWLHENFPTMSDLAWQEGYGAFTVSRSNIDAVAQYIQNQEAHHGTMTFEQEYRELLDKHGIEYDERYLWG